MRRRAAMLRRVAIALAAALACAPLPARTMAAAAPANSAGAASEPGDAARRGPLAWSQLTGDWGGARRRLEARGVTVSPAYTGMALTNRTGGRQRGTFYLDNFDFTVTADAETLMNWPGATFFLYGLRNHGDTPTDYVGDAQTLSNIEAFSTWRLYEAWVEQNLNDGRVSLLAGLYDLNSEFDFIEAAQLFINSSFGIGPDFSQSGLNGPSIFPVTSLALRAIIKPRPAVRIQAAILDGVPGDLDAPHGTHIALGGGDGALVAAEVAYTGVDGSHDDAADRATGPRHDRIGRGAVAHPATEFSFGGWHYTARFDDLRDVDPGGDPVRRAGNHGFYGSFEHYFFADGSRAQRYVAIFLRGGVANDRLNRFGSSLTGGVSWRGVVPGRPEDEFGLAVASARNGRTYRRAQSDDGIGVDRAETAVELTYGAALTPWLVVQPDVQYIIHPDTDRALRNALVFGLAFELTF